MTLIGISPPEDDSTLSILLIEDDGSDASLVLESLRAYPGHRFNVTAESGIEAGVKALRGAKPDAVILDTDGDLAAVEELRTANPSLPLIVLSGDDTGEKGLRAMDAGAQDYLLKKHLNYATLGQTVLQAIARQQLRTELAERLRQIESTHIRLRNIIDMALDGILVIDDRGRIMFANRTANRLLHLEGGERLRRHLRKPTAESDNLVFTLLDESRQPCRLHMRIYPTGWDEENAFMVLLREPLPTETNEGESKLLPADCDSTTGLFNRDAFSRQGREILYRAGRKDTSAAVLCLNLERFRRVNQALGHDTGDAVLKYVAERLKRELRAGDLLGCFGSDEFLVLLTSLRRPRDASIVAGKLLDAAALPIEHENGDLRMQARVGISLFPRDGSDISELIGHAQIAAERAKRWQPHRVAYYTPELMSQTTWHFQLEQDLQTGLANRQFKLLYQPIVDVRSNRLVAAEALLRWQPTPDTVMSANEFIPVLEETGLIDEVGAWVIRTACIEAKTWHDGGHPIPVTVNLSPLQFASEDLPEKIRTALADSKLPPEYLWVEITESALMQSLDRSIEMLGQLRAMGVSVCIDDFGTGFSSLAHLKRFPIDTLKIDSSFVRDIVDSARDAAITRNTVDLAHALNLTVVAEGVESEAQLEYLREYGCDFYQGYVYREALVMEEIRKLIEQAK